MEPSDTCGFCGRKGHYDDQCPRRWRGEPADEPADEPAPVARVTWHARPGGSVAADICGKVLGQVTQLERSDTWAARAGAEFLGEYVTLEAAMRAVERALNH
jgi:hypothetical protein